MAKFNASPTHALYTGVSGRLAYLHALPQWPVPFVVFSFRAIAPADTFTERLQWVEVLFSVFAGRAGEVEVLQGGVCNLFELATFSAPGIADFVLDRVDIIETDRDESGLFHGAVSLAGLVEQTL